MPRWGQTIVASVGSGLFMYVLIASKLHIVLIASIRHIDIFSEQKILFTNDIFLSSEILAFIQLQTIYIYSKFISYILQRLK